MQFDPALQVEAGTSLRYVIDRMQAEKQASVVICKGSRVIGILTERDVVRCLADEVSLDQPVDAVMSLRPVTVTPRHSVGQAIHRMSAGGFRRLPVVDDEGTPLGMVKVSHILHHLVQNFPQTVYNLPPKPNVTVHEREGA